jgi:ribA/ribD-fused uncharacterized protein
MNHSDPIRLFRGRYAFLSNFYATPVSYQGQTYVSVEHAYQALKCEHASDQALVAAASTAAEAKKMGRQAQMRPDWEAVKLQIMRELVWAKFQDQKMLLSLMTTGDAPLEEHNTWGDTYWGICNGVGENWLGRILMQTREKLKSCSTW